MSWWADWGKDVVLAILALYGAGLTTLTVRQALKKERRAVKVELATVRPTYGPEIGPPHAKVVATNIGSRKVTISEVYLACSEGKLVSFAHNPVPWLPDTPLPAVIEDGESAHMCMSYADIGQALLRAGFKGKVLLTPMARDTTGGAYRGNAWKTDAADLLHV